MAKKKPTESFETEQIVFELDNVSYRLVRLNPNTMEAVVRTLDDGRESSLPFAHLPKHVKKQIRPL